jgi:amino acid adenylation domain-containing protein
MSLLPISSQSVSGETPQEFALSVGQQAVWAVYRMSPDSGAYNLACAMRIRMPLDVQALQRALQALVDRHTALRTTFTLAQGKPVQRIWPRQDVSFQHEDATLWDEKTLGQSLGVEVNRPFDLEGGPLFRAHLYARSADEHILLIVTHYIISDYWSQLTLARELGALYDAALNGTSVSLPPLELEYTDYIRRHTALMESSQGEQLAAYWQAQLAGNPPILNLPTDWPRPPIQTHRGGSQSCLLDAELTQRLKQFSREHDVTLYTTLLAAFQVLLYRYTGQDDLWVGAPVAGRNQPGYSDLVGYFSNYVVLRARLEGNLSFVAFLAQARQTVQGALDHQDYAFAALVQQLHREHDASRSPLFQVAFAFMDANLPESESGAALVMGVDEAEMSMGGLKLESLSLEEPASQFDLTLMVGEMKEKLAAQLRYNADLFEAASMSRMLGHWQTLLQSILADPNQTVSRLGLLTDAERQQMLAAWNDTKRDYVHDRCIHECFEAQVARAPDAVAIIGPEAVTYQQLNARANQLARHLRSLGVKAEDRVGLCMERSVDVITGFWGILKAGGAYVPIDPQYPQERKRFILQDTQASVLLTQASLRDSLAPLGVRLVCLDADWPLAAQQSAENLSPLTCADNPAYLIYTSGSTGEPKGVMITHANLWPHVQAMQTVMQITEKDRQLLSQSFSFSASVRQFLVPLCSGASVVIASNEQAHDPLALFELMKEKEATMWGVTPSFWRNCIDVLRSATPEKRAWLLENKLRLIISSAESMSPDIPRMWAQELGHTAQAVNMLGLTEVSGVFTAYPIPSDLREQRNVPVGRPISNARVYILDQNLEPTPVGLPGEVYVGGSYLARGYHNRPDLTAKLFVPNPFTPPSPPPSVTFQMGGDTGGGGGRLYRTGDLARYRADGVIEFLERADYQIKIRGFRIEPGEVEAALARHPLVRQAVVMGQKNPASEQAADDKQLVAYVEIDPSAKLTPGDLRGFAKEQLPDYMVPAAFVLLEKLPLTATGKVNRKALPPADAGHFAQDGTAYAPPRNPVEEVLARMWAKLLSVERVGIHDDFFDLGGHSLLAIQAISYLQEVLQIEEPLIAYFFENPTVAGVSDALMQTGAGQGDVAQIAEVLNLIADLSEEDMDEILKY